MSCDERWEGGVKSEDISIVKIKMEGLILSNDMGMIWKGISPNSSNRFGDSD